MKGLKQLKETGIHFLVYTWLCTGLGRTRLDLVGVPDVEMDQRELGPSSVPMSSSERAASSSRGGRMVGNGLPSPLTPPVGHK